MNITLFALTNDNQVATIKASLGIAVDYWESIITAQNANGQPDPYTLAMAEGQRAQHAELLAKIEREVW